MRSSSVVYPYVTSDYFVTMNTIAQHYQPRWSSMWNEMEWASERDNGNNGGWVDLYEHCIKIMKHNLKFSSESVFQMSSYIRVKIHNLQWEHVQCGAFHFKIACLKASRVTQPFTSLSRLFRLDKDEMVDSRVPRTVAHHNRARAYTLRYMFCNEQCNRQP